MGIVEFPQDDVEHRLRTILSVLPELGRALSSAQSRFSIRQSDQAAADYSLMQKADVQIEKGLLDAVTSFYKSDRVTSEEAGETGGTGDFHWWMDPVDGTRNYIHGLPLYAMSVGLCFRGTPVAGAVYAPALSEMYHAIYGSGAFKNDQPIEVSNVASIERSLVATGLPYHRKEILADLMADISTFVSSGSGLRRTGSAILDMCWIAEGRLEAMWERGVKPWDTCAASLIVQEAGGKLSGFLGEPFDLNTRDILVTNGYTHTTIVEILRQARTVEGMN